MSNVSGAYDVTIKSPMGDQKSVFTVNADGGKIAAEIDLARLALRAAPAGNVGVAGDTLADGNDKPAHITHMTMLAQQMGFMSNSAHTSLQSVGTALETMARKQ